jgi:hypothetical protein
VVQKIRGSLVYFGRGSHDEALALYQQQASDLHAGRKPRDADPDALTVFNLCGKFLTAKRDQRDQGELSPRMFAEYGDVCKRLIKVLGKRIARYRSVFTACPPSRGFAMTCPSVWRRRR